MISRLKLRKKLVLFPAFLGDRKDWNKRILCLRWAFPALRYIAFYDDWKQDIFTKVTKHESAFGFSKKRHDPYAKPNAFWNCQYQNNKKEILPFCELLKGSSNIVSQQCKKLCPCCNAVRCSTLLELGNIANSLSVHTNRPRTISVKSSWHNDSKWHCFGHNDDSFIKFTTLSTARAAMTSARESWLSLMDIHALQLVIL